MNQTHPPPINIIKANLEHLDLVAPLFDAYRVFYKQPPDLAGARAYIRARLENEESIIYLAVAEEGDGLAGLGFTQLYPSFSSISLKRLWILYDLFVATRSRRQGVAKALMERARQLARATGAGEIMLDTAKDNTPAQALYEALGYERDEEFYTYYLMV